MSTGSPMLCHSYFSPGCTFKIKKRSKDHFFCIYHLLMMAFPNAILRGIIKCLVLWESPMLLVFLYACVVLFAVCAFPYILAFTTDSIEIRLVVNGNLVYTAVVPELQLSASRVRMSPYSILFIPHFFQHCSLQHW